MSEDMELPPQEVEEKVVEKTPAPRNATSHEVAYLRQLIDGLVPVVIKIKGGEQVSGVIEYYDNSFIRLTREGDPNLFIFKKDILYLRENGPAVSEAAPAAAASEAEETASE